MRLFAGWSVLGASALALACTHDFDSFEHGGASVADSGTGASRTDGATNGNGGASGAGTGDASSGGVGGLSGGGGAAASMDARAPIDGAPVDGSMGGARDGSTSSDGSVGQDAARNDAGPGAGGAGTDSGTGAGGTGTGGTGCLATEKLCGVNCVQNDSPATGCNGASCTPCAALNASTAKCVAGACAPDVCLSGFGDCNGVAADGCEHDVTTDPLACGACGRGCAGDHVEARSCAAGLCQSSCVPGRANCNRPTTGPDDGCEIDATTDSANCGGCGNDCSMQDGKSCIGGTCGCTGDAQCISGPAQGTITCDTTAHVCHCDANVCQRGESCRAGACSCNAGNACPATSTCCRAGCRNLMTDAQNCGACAHVCSPGFVCTAGACRCNGNNDCRGGTCVGGLCQCGSTMCTEGQRCLSNGSCG